MQKLKEMRRRNGLTQKEIAKLLGINKNSYACVLSFEKLLVEINITLRTEIKSKYYYGLIAYFLYLLFKTVKSACSSGYDPYLLDSLVMSGNL